MEIVKDDVIRKEIESIPKLLGVTEVGKQIGNWDRRKVHTYWKRGIIPEPAAFIGNRPVWTESQIANWINTRLKDN